MVFSDLRTLVSLRESTFRDIEQARAPFSVLASDIRRIWTAVLQSPIIHEGIQFDRSRIAPGQEMVAHG